MRLHPYWPPFQQYHCIIYICISLNLALNGLPTKKWYLPVVQDLNFGDLVVTADYRGAGCYTALHNTADPTSIFCMLKKNRCVGGGLGVWGVQTGVFCGGVLLSGGLICIIAVASLICNRLINHQVHNNKNRTFAWFSRVRL